MDYTKEYDRMVDQIIIQQELIERLTRTNVVLDTLCEERFNEISTLNSQCFAQRADNDNLWEMIENAQHASNATGLIGMVGSEVWVGQIKKGVAALEVKLDMEPVSMSLEFGGLYSTDQLAALQADRNFWNTAFHEGAEVYAEERSELKVENECLRKENSVLNTLCEDRFNEIASLHSDLERVTRERDDLLDFIKRAPVSSGVCCCGDDMETHQYNDHKPVDIWDNAVAGLVAKYGKIENA